MRLTIEAGDQHARGFWFQCQVLGGREDGPFFFNTARERDLSLASYLGGLSLGFEENALQVPRVKR